MSTKGKLRQRIKPSAAERALLGCFARGGCVRIANAKLRKTKPRVYKKGYEIRFTANSKADLKHVRTLLARAGMKAGSPYRKGTQTIQPVYGRSFVERFLSLLKRRQTDPG